MIPSAPSHQTWVLSPNHCSIMDSSKNDKNKLSRPALVGPLSFAGGKDFWFKSVAPSGARQICWILTILIHVNLFYVISQKCTLFLPRTQLCVFGPCMVNTYRSCLAKKENWVIGETVPGSQLDWVTEISIYWGSWASSRLSMIGHWQVWASSVFCSNPEESNMELNRFPLWNIICSASMPASRNWVSVMLTTKGVCTRNMWLHMLQYCVPVSHHCMDTMERTPNGIFFLLFRAQSASVCSSLDTSSVY